MQKAHARVIAAIVNAIQQPIRYAGQGEYTVFEKPKRLFEMGAGVVPLPGTSPNDVCVVVSSSLWASFRALSLWIEALSIHDWCLFVGRVAQERGDKLNRGDVYLLLTARPDNRRPLTWECSHVELLMMEGTQFICRGAESFGEGARIRLDHLLPLAIYPVNELWNLLPADKQFNQNIKRDQIPNAKRLINAQPLIAAAAYTNYEKSPALKQAVREDASVRFSALPADSGFSAALAAHTVDFIEQVAGARSVSRF